MKHKWNNLSRSQTGAPPAGSAGLRFAGQARNHENLISQIKPNPNMNTRNILLTVAALIFSLGIGSASAQLWRLSLYGTNTWTSVASSADGARLVAVAGSGQIFTSTNGGSGFNSAWITNNAPAVAWTGVASSADGNRLVAVNTSDWRHLHQFGNQLGVKFQFVRVILAVRRGFGKWQQFDCGRTTHYL